MSSSSSEYSSSSSSWFDCRGSLVFGVASPRWLWGCVGVSGWRSASVEGEEVGGAGLQRWGRGREREGV